MNEVTSKLFNLVKIENTPELEAWNQTSSQLIATARVNTLNFYWLGNWIFINSTILIKSNQIYGDIFVIFSNLSCILSNKFPTNQQALAELFELYLLYEICEVYSANILRVILNLIYSGLFFETINVLIFNLS